MDETNGTRKLIDPTRSESSIEEDRPFATTEEALAAFDALAEEIGRHLSPDAEVSAVDMIREQRREL